MLAAYDLIENVLVAFAAFSKEAWHQQQEGEAPVMG